MNQAKMAFSIPIRTEPAVGLIRFADHIVAGLFHKGLYYWLRVVELCVPRRYEFQLRWPVKNSTATAIRMTVAGDQLQ
ncbi:MAG: hypothetical protein C4523_14125 [Myxococcales bacterium]|nr:MAG: hypothetical protein C4523_14125 [Myxococcales bacterium]